MNRAGLILPSITGLPYFCTQFNLTIFGKSINRTKSPKNFLYSKMAKTTRRRYYRKRAKWSSNIQELMNTSITASQGNWSGTSVLATNPVQNTLGVSQIFTCKNFSIDFTIESDTHWSLEGITAYIMFVPQGMNVSESYNLEHPEYIMNYKYLGSPTGTGTSTTAEVQQYQPFRLRSRLSRRLNTGDSVILFIKGLNQGSSNINLNLSGLVRWWTKAN